MDTGLCNPVQDQVNEKIRAGSLWTLDFVTLYRIKRFLQLNI
jgi:hypothetical protein